MSPVPSPAPQAAPPQNSSALSSRQKQKPIPIGIAAGAEDAKYQAKYKELKRKVKDIEVDNEKLHFKVLQSKLSIRRMKMERAILYERLSVLPSSPTLADRAPLPPSHAPSGLAPIAPSSRSLPPSHHPSALDPDQQYGIPDHVRSQGNPRLVPDSRSIPILENSVASNVAPSPHMSVHSPRRHSSGHHESARYQYPPSNPMPPVHPYENSRHSNSHTSPSMHHAHPTSSHSRNRSHSSSRSRSHQLPPQPYRSSGTGHPMPYPESISASQQPLHSPPLSDRERSRRGDYHEYPSSHGDPHSYDRHQAHIPVSPPRTHPSEARSSTRIHNHQRLGPASYINREDQYERHNLERDREWERERERERERTRDYGRSSREMISPNMHSPHSVPRSRPTPMDRDYDHHVSSSRAREEPPYHSDHIHAPAPYPPARLSRSDTPASGSASGSGAGAAEGAPSRPASRSQPYYEHDRQRTSANFRLRPVSGVNEEGEFAGAGVHEDGRSHGGPHSSDRDRERGGPPYSISEQNRPLESRKRSRNDMDVDSDNDVVADGTSGGGGHYSARMQEDRSSKRYHRDQRRSSDNHEESRMGPSS